MSPRSLPRPTLKDVARQAGVSVTTAHVALTGRWDGVRVSEPTRERVRRVADQLGYRPNLLARNLKTSRTGTFGFLSDRVTTTPFAVSMLAAVQEEAALHGYLVFVVSLDVRAPDDERRRAVDVLLQQQVEGLLYACMYHRVVPRLPGLPPGTVFLNAREVGGGHRGIVPDERQGAHDVAAELVAAGHRRIAFLDDHRQPPASALRRQGYAQALAAAGVRPDPRLQLAAPAVVAGGLQVERLLDLPARTRPTAVFCFNDRMAMGVYRAARHRGLRIPDDLSVAGFDDQEYIASELDPPLTTARLPHAEMGRLAVRLMLDDATVPAQGRRARTHRVPCPLVRRGSVGPA